MILTYRINHIQFGTQYIIIFHSQAMKSQYTPINGFTRPKHPFQIFSTVFFLQLLVCISFSIAPVVDTALQVLRILYRSPSSHSTMRSPLSSPTTPSGPPTLTPQTTRSSSPGMGSSRSMSISYPSQRPEPGPLRLLLLLLRELRQQHNQALQSLREVRNSSKVDASPTSTIIASG